MSGTELKHCTKHHRSFYNVCHPCYLDSASAATVKGTFKIGPRTGVETYSMRGNTWIPSDKVCEFSRVINGRSFDFARVEWANGAVTVTARKGGTTIVLHQWESEATS